MNGAQNFFKPTLYLASSSPRRRQLLEAIGISFEVLSPDVEEQAEPAALQTIEQMTMANAYLKASSLLAQVNESQSIILGADTVVVVDGKPLGKPADSADATQMLRTLSGRTHEVITGLSFLSPRFGQRQSFEKSGVRFRPLSEEEIQQYISLKEPYDKAGSYAVQGLGALFIERIEGSYTNVMGLPIEKMLSELSRLVKRPVFDFFERRPC